MTHKILFYLPGSRDSETAKELFEGDPTTKIIAADASLLAALHHDMSIDELPALITESWRLVGLSSILTLLER